MAQRLSRRGSSSSRQDYQGVDDIVRDTAPGHPSAPMLGDVDQDYDPGSQGAAGQASIRSLFHRKRSTSHSGSRPSSKTRPSVSASEIIKEEVKKKKQMASYTREQMSRLGSQMARNRVCQVAKLAPPFCNEHTLNKLLCTTK